METVGADDTRSPGREKNHDEAGTGRSRRTAVSCAGLAKIQPRPSDEVNGGPEVDDDDDAAA